MPVHVGDEVKTLGGRDKFIQRQHRHLRPEVGAADADVHHVGDGGVGTHLLGLGQHGLAGGLHLGHRISYAFNSKL